ncbi:MAG TPA: glycogen debranching protein GlgX [Pseudolysinimonas sp.]|nr:glycogen debranching protein GlgX [Pseudolysinimonas sp.]
MPLADPMRDLGVRLTADGGTLRVWSAHATSLDLCLIDPQNANRVIDVVPLARADEEDAAHIWTVTTPALHAGAAYALRADGPEGPRHAFDPHQLLLDPYARGLSRAPDGSWRAVVQDDDFDWGGVEKPQTRLDRAVLYEAHVIGLSKLNPRVPEQLRGTYAGLAHEATIEHLTELGITAIELLPVHQHVSEQRLLDLGMVNYWGYNTLNFFTPHAQYASAAAQEAGPAAIVREFRGMVRLLHEAGIQVILDVVFNHTAEEGRLGPTTSLRGLDNSSYYRQDDDGSYIDVTGCGNTVDASNPAAQRLILDSLRYWANDMQIDGFRFDLAVALARNEEVEFDPQHPLLQAIMSDPQLAGVTMIAEPWDVGAGGWQGGKFPDGWSEWNDGYRDRMRSFWLQDIGAARDQGLPSEGIGSLARRLAGSNHVFSTERGPVASVNFITAHDGFTALDLVSYTEKHNLGNREQNNDGTNDNRSFNHGVEGPSDDPAILTVRYKAVRNLLGTLLLSAGIPMLTAGDEFGRTQGGNNNAYCHDDEVSWLSWDIAEEDRKLHSVAKRLIELRRENPALRPERYGVFGETTPGATQMDWYNKDGQSMELEDWDSPAERTLQYLAASTPEFEPFNRILLVVHGLETEVQVTLPEHEGVASYTLLWDSSHDDIDEVTPQHAPGDQLTMGPTSIMLFRADEPTSPSISIAE